MSQNRGKGRRKFTVDSLFQDTSPRAAGVRDLVEAKTIDIDRIAPDPDQPRQSFDDDLLDELATSIAREGVLQPIAVRYDVQADQYVIIHGERRWRASKRAGLTAMPAVVRDVPDDRRLIHQLMENVVREDLNAIDRAAALRQLKRQMGNAPWEQVAASVGIKRSRLFQLLSTEKLADSVQDRIRSGQISEKQTRSLQGLPHATQVALVELLSDGASQKEVQSIARTLRGDETHFELDEQDLRSRIQDLRSPEHAGGPVESDRVIVDPLVRALRIASGVSDLPDSPHDALDELKTREHTRSNESSGYFQVIEMLGNIASGRGAGSLTPSQIDGLKRLADLALKAHRESNRR